MEGLSPDSLHDQQVLITVVSSEGDYQKQVSSYIGSASLASYYVLRVGISEEAPPGGTGFALNPLSPWPKPGGTIHNSNSTVSLGPVNPEVAWMVPDLSLAGMPVVDPEGRVFVSRDLAGGGTTLLAFDSHGLSLAQLDFPDFEPNGDPILVGCSLMWNDQQGRVQRLFMDGSDEVFFVPVPGPGATAYSMLNMDNSGRAFMHGLNGIQAFDKNGSPIWWRFGIDEGPSTFLGPLTVAADGTVVAGKLDLSSGPGCDFKFVGINPATGKDLWVHEPTVSDSLVSCSAADPATGQIYYAVENHIVALRNDGGETWRYEGHNFFLPSIAIGPGSTIYSAETVLGQSGGNSRVVALDPQGEELWDYDCQNSITTGPIVDSAGFVYFATSESEVFCLYPDGSLRWTRDLYGNIYYLVFGPPRSVLVGLREPTYTATMVCLQDIG
jgi:hypothetical protein